MKLESSFDYICSKGWGTEDAIYTGKTIVTSDMAEIATKYGVHVNIKAINWIPNL